MANTCSATSSATCCSTCVATCGQCESTITGATVVVFDLSRVVFTLCARSVVSSLVIDRHAECGYTSCRKLLLTSARRRRRRPVSESLMRVVRFVLTYLAVMLVDVVQEQRREAQGDFALTVSALHVDRCRRPHWQRNFIAFRGVARILVWGGIKFRDLVSMAVISLSRHDIPHVVRV